MTTTDPIVDEVRSVRDQHAARFAYDLNRIFLDIKAKQEASGRKFVQYPSRPAVTSTAVTSNQD